MNASAKPASAGDRDRSAKIPRLIADAVDRVGSEGFGRSLVELLRGQVFFDSSLVLSYRPERRPDIILDLMQHAARENSAAHYVAGAYLLDPFYVRASELAEPALLRMKDIAPADFLSSDYYVSYYKGSKVNDEVNYLVPDGHGGIVAVCIERSVVHAPFDDADVATLSQWLPAIAALCRRHASVQGPPADRGPDIEHARLASILGNLGRTVLTPREHEIVQFMLHGHTAPAVALKLGLSVETVRVHRRNIYDKLKITSLAELFSLALKAIYSARRSDIDPLLEVKPELAR
jgi:DNA-binding CsgD family transcriptional regulator